MDEALKRLRSKLVQYGDRTLTGEELARLIDEVSGDIQAAHSGPEPYDLSSRPGPRSSRCLKRV